MRVAVVGGTGVIGMSVARCLTDAGHEVVALAHLCDHDAMVSQFRGADAVANFAARAPGGYSALWPGSWRAHDRLRTEGVRRVVSAARDAGVRRLVQESVSYLYADQGDEWITEQSPLGITRATEPASVGEAHVQEYQCGSRVGVVLRFGAVLGDDHPMTRLQLRATRTGWAHLLHAEDVGPAVLAALSAPTGVYNVGAEPVRRTDLAAGFARAAGRASAEFVSPMLVRAAGARLEPLTRSLRVSSEHFTATTGWTPGRAVYDATWLPNTDATSEVSP